MAEDFFSEVAGPIPFGGPASTDPLAFKVYEPDRLVLGKRMEDHLRIGRLLLALVRLARASTCSASGRSTGPWLDRRLATRWTAARTKMAVAFEFFDEARHPVLLLPRSRRRARGRDASPSSARTSTPSSTTPRATRSGPASGCCGARPTCSPTRATRPAPPPTPIPRSSPTPRRRSSTCSRSPSGSAARTTSCGAAARATTRCSTRTSSARATSSRGSCTSSPSTSTRSASRAQLLIEPKPMEPTKHQYDYDSRPSTASWSGTGSRASTASTSRPTTRRSPGTASITRSPTRSPTGSSAASTPTAATRRTAGTPTSSRTRSRTSRCRCTRSCAAAGSRPGGFNFDAKLRRQSTDRTDLFHAHIGGIDTLARALLVAADLIERGELAERQDARYAGWDGALGTAILDGTETLESLEAKVAAGDDRPAARVRAIRSSSRTSSTSRSGRRPADGATSGAGR